MYWWRKDIDSREFEAAMTAMVLTVFVPLSIGVFGSLAAAFAWAVTDHNHYEQIMDWCMVYQKNKQGRVVMLGPDLNILGRYELGVVFFYIAYQTCEGINHLFRQFKGAMA